MTHAITCAECDQHIIFSEISAIVHYSCRHFQFNHDDKGQKKSFQFFRYTLVLLAVFLFCLSKSFRPTG
jgi:hypothetical protein